MPKIDLIDGCVTLDVTGQQGVLSAEEVFSVVFEGAVSLRGISISSDDFLSSGIDFRKQTADAFVVIEADPADRPNTIQCRLIAKSFNFEADIPSHNGHLLDYAIDGGVWMPLASGTTDSIKTFLKRNDLDNFGKISLGQYLKIISIEDPCLSIDDRTNQSLSAERFSESLQGSEPVGLVGKLYPYQLAGYRWLEYMKKNGLGCIIADEMGLGKTIQVICMLLESKRQGNIPCLVVTPATLITNWRREIKRFAPSLAVIIHKGYTRTGFPDVLREKDVVLTSYDTAVADISLMRGISWSILVIDEAQAIKNPNADRTRQLKTIPHSSAVAMTGTPIENRLTDIWSITDFAVPELLGNRSDFEHKYPDTVDAAAALEPILSPIILRRRVEDVAGDLPERIVIPQPMDLDPVSVTIYEMLRSSVSSDTHGQLGSLVRLRMFCTHPWLTGQMLQSTSASECSIKVQRLFEVLEEIIAKDGKTIIFTSFHKSIDLLTREILHRFRITTETIDGRTEISKRQATIDRFTGINGPAVLVLNPKAAGVGLNITAANHVIHFNLEWNPAVEDQATARAYRRGQSRVVTVHRFFYVNTVEDVINDRMTHKRSLAQSAVVGTEGTAIDMKDIIRALRISPMNAQNREE